MREIFGNIILAGLGLILVTVGIGLFLYLMSAILTAFFSARTETKEAIKERHDRETEYEDLKLLAEIGKELIISCREGAEIGVRDVLKTQLDPNKYWARLTESSFKDITGKELSQYHKHN